MKLSLLSDKYSIIQYLLTEWLLNSRNSSGVSGDKEAYDKTPSLKECIVWEGVMLAWIKAQNAAAMRDACMGMMAPKKEIEAYMGWGKGPENSYIHSTFIKCLLCASR